MNTSVLLLLAACVCASLAAPELRARTKQQRPTRGFKNLEMMTARGFGKRGGGRAEHQRVTYIPSGRMQTSADYGKRSGSAENYDEVYGGEQPEETFWETLDQPEMDVTDSRDDKRDSEKEGVKLRHTVDDRKRRRLSKSRPRSVKSVKGTKEKKLKRTKANGEEKLRISVKTLGSIAVDTFTKEMVKNPEFAKTVVRRFIDHNLDGYLTEDELLKASV